MLGDDPGRLPAIGGIGIGIGGGLKVAAGFHQGRLGCDESVFGVGVAGLETVHEALRELPVADPQGGAHHLGEEGGAVR